jgi:hypothetical protein
MRISKDKSTTIEESFKANKNTHSKLDDIEEKFVRRLKKGSGKYQGKIPFKCFNFGKIGNFGSKFPHKKRTKTLMMKRNTNLRKVCVQKMMTPQKT